MFEAQNVTVDVSIGPLMLKQVAERVRSKNEKSVKFIRSEAGARAYSVG